jgi:hypothetical protein
MRACYPITLISLAGLLVSCGGGGGPPPAPTVTFSAAAADARIGGTVTLTWSSTNADGCSAGGDWTGSLASSGSQSVNITKELSTFNLTCTGRGGSANGTAAVTGWNAPSLSLTSSDSELLSGNTAKLDWAATNVKSCRGSNGFTETIANSGTLTTPALTQTVTYALECSNPAFPAVNSSVTITVSDTFELLVTAKYERPGPSKINSSGRLEADMDNPVTAPIRNVYIELQDSNGNKVAGTHASEVGSVRFTGLDPKKKYIPLIKSVAKNSSGFEIHVLDNMRPISSSANTIRTRYEPYLNRAAEFTADSRRIKQATELTARLGWDAALKILRDDQRISAPYIVLTDAMEQQAYVAQNGAVNSVDSISILWSAQNKGGATDDNNYDRGFVRSSGAFYSRSAITIAADGKVSSGGSENIPHIFLSGAPAFELQELSTAITAHEMTHFTQDKSQRNYSPGGPHSERGEHQDIALVQHEGIATGTALMIARSPTLDRFIFRDGSVRTVRSDYRSNDTPLGWFQERTVIQFIWRLFDPAGTIKLSGPQILAPFYSQDWRTGTFGPNIWAYAKVLKTQHPTLAGNIDAVGTSLNITLAGNDEWGSTESILGNRSSSQTFPIFTRVPLNGSVTVCAAGSANEYNKLSNRRYLRFDGDGTTRRYTVTGANNMIPVFVVARSNGSLAGGYAKGVRNIFVDQAVPAEGSWGWVGECSVVLSSISETTRSECSATSYTAPAEQCFTITAAPAPTPAP